MDHVESLASLGPALERKRDWLLSVFESFRSCVVALSGGVDSAVVAKAAQLALGDQALAVTGVSASLAEGELAAARDLAELIGIRHTVVKTDEFAKAAYTDNAPDRCYHCKSELYSLLEALSDKFESQVIVNGANVDDLSDYRPGMQAARERAVRSPLAECGFSKDDVRCLARFWELPVWNKPASPCLSSRIAYGEEVTPERLHMVDQAEQLLRSFGIELARVRYHRGDLARIEIPVKTLPRLCQADIGGQIVEKLKAMGFRFVTVDLEGFRSGSLNTLLPSLQLVQLGSGPAKDLVSDEDPIR